MVRDLGEITYGVFNDETSDQDIKAESPEEFARQHNIASPAD